MRFAQRLLGHRRLNFAKLAQTRLGLRNGDVGLMACGGKFGRLEFDQQITSANYLALDHGYA
ncbi:hypothetical protein ELE36_12755 [Pseudolysobacter antarcticus]|uniref:Uncharacterized protein n=1 Tax=Pseudolysobacter antarcticus TaxID=2511995 RepID=A0A411HL73_9GAMM|nr:hypothetical protein [Pseudolysobacter antarcticus]QBB71150.1 hypothetical protein ELE36_12755 [Pseudolysobacter antarcticus]